MLTRAIGANAATPGIWNDRRNQATSRYVRTAARTTDMTQYARVNWSSFIPFRRSYRFVGIAAEM